MYMYQAYEKISALHLELHVHRLNIQLQPRVSNSMESGLLNFSLASEMSRLGLPNFNFASQCPESQMRWC